MTADKQHAHALLDRVPADQMTAAVRFLEFLLLDSVDGALATAPVEDEEITSETAAALDRARASLARGEGIPHEEILREFGLMK